VLPWLIKAGFRLYPATASRPLPRTSRAGSYVPPERDKPSFNCPHCGAPNGWTGMPRLSRRGRPGRKRAVDFAAVADLPDAAGGCRVGERTSRGVAPTCARISSSASGWTRHPRRRKWARCVAAGAGRTGCRRFRQRGPSNGSAARWQDKPGQACGGSTSSVATDKEGPARHHRRRTLIP
jgi:hypothetical protein